MNNIRKIMLSLAMIFISTATFAGQPEMADELYHSGKIYVVVIVLSLIFIGIVGYLIMLDRKISKLEKEIERK